MKKIISSLLMFLTCTTVVVKAQSYATIPFFCNFEDTLENSAWGSNSLYPPIQWCIGDAVSYNGQNASYLSQDNGISTYISLNYDWFNECYLYRDVYLDTAFSEYMLVFYFKSLETWLRTPALYIFAESPVDSGFVAPANENVIKSVSVSDTQWHEVRVVINHVHGGLQRIFFKYKNDGTANHPRASCVIDDIMITGVPIGRPYDLGVSNISCYSASLYWESGNRQAPASYQLAYCADPDTTFNVLEVTDTFFTLAALSPQTNYRWKVRAVASSGDTSAWSDEKTFYTLAATPYECDFENEVENAQWTRGHYSVNMSSDWVINAAPADSGNVSLHISTSLGNGIYTSSIFNGSTLYPSNVYLWAYRDIFFGGGGSRYQISFDYKGLGQVGADFARVYIGPLETPSGQMPPAGSEQIGGDFCMNPIWTHYSFEVDTSHNGWQRLYFQWRNDVSLGENPAAAFDNIVVRATDCAIPKNINTISVTETTATLSWNNGNNGASPSNYTVAYRLLNDSVFTEVTTTDTILQIIGLQSDSYYLWQVRANCSSMDSSSWSSSRIFATAQSTVATLPYDCSFEDPIENAAWTIRKISGSNNWVIGDAVHFDGQSAIYISDDGVNYHYSYQLSQAWAYRDIYFAPGNIYDIDFYFKGTGCNVQYARVFLGYPEPLFEDVIPENAVQLGDNLYNVSEWQHFHFSLDSTYSGLRRLYVQWYISGAMDHQPPAAFDNFSIEVEHCQKPIGLISETTDHSAMLSWSMRFGGSGASYTVAYRSQYDTAYTYVNVVDTFLNIQNLRNDIFYYWKVRHNCNSSNMSWSEENMFYTHDQLLYLCDFDSPESFIGWDLPEDNNGMRWYVGRNNGSRPNGTLYVSADSGLTNCYNANASADVWAYRDVFIKPGHSGCYLSFDFKGMGTTDDDYMNVYIGTPALPSGSSTPSNAVVVAQKLGQKSDWTHYTFSIDSTHSGFQRVYFLWHNDNSEGTNPPASIDNISLSYEIFRIPDILQVSLYDTMAYVLWDNVDTIQPLSYTLAYAILPLDTQMREIRVLGTVSDLVNLQPNSSYLCKVRANYGQGRHSMWRMTQFQTLYRFAKSPYYCDFENSTENDNWQFINNGSTNRWTIGDAESNGGESSLYVSDDEGTSNSYVVNAYTNAWAYRNIYLNPANSPYIISFDFKGKGEDYAGAIYDYARVYIGLPSTPDAPLDIFPNMEGLVQIGSTFYQQDDWITFSETLDSVLNGHLCLYFFWRNDTFWGDNPPAAFDNISIVPVDPGGPGEDSVGVAGYQLEQVISLYPNPASSNLYVWTREGVNVLFIEIYDLFGRLIQSLDAAGNPKSIHISGMSSGMYLMRITTDKGVITKKFVRR